MTTDDERPIAWPALGKDTTVLASDGSVIGKVARVIGDEDRDIFTGLTVTSGLFDKERFVPGEHVGAITHSEVTLDLSSSEAGELEPYED